MAAFGSFETPWSIRNKLLLQRVHLKPLQGRRRVCQAKVDSQDPRPIVDDTNPNDCLRYPFFLTWMVEQLKLNLHTGQL